MRDVPRRYGQRRARELKIETLATIQERRTGGSCPRPQAMSELTTDERMPQQPEPIVSTLLQSEPELEDLVDKFVSQLPELIRELHHLHAEAAWPAFRHKVHDLKGMGGNFGFQMLSELAEHMEQAVRADDLGALAPLLEELDGLHARIRAGHAPAAAQPRALG